jgi:hypothetical protein
MNVLHSANSLVSQLVLLVEGVNCRLQQAAFEKIKRRLLREDLRKLSKGGFVSVNSTSDNDSLSNFNSISSFRPLEHNYSSVKILEYDSHGVEDDLRNSRARRLESPLCQLSARENSLERWMVREGSAQLSP